MLVPDGGPLAVVALPSAFALASELADDQKLRLPPLTETSAGRLELDVVFAMLIETAAATLIAPLDEFAGGVAGAEPPLPPFAVRTPVPNERWLATWWFTSGVPDPSAAAPFALAFAAVAVPEAPDAPNSTLPGVAKLLRVVAVTEWSATPSASAAPTEVFVPMASPSARVVTGADVSVALATRLPVIPSVTPVPTAASVLKPEYVNATTGVTAVPPAAPPADLATKLRLVVGALTVFPESADAEVFTPTTPTASEPANPTFEAAPAPEVALAPKAIVSGASAWTRTPLADSVVFPRRAVVAMVARLTAIATPTPDADESTGPPSASAAECAFAREWTFCAPVVVTWRLPVVAATYASVAESSLLN